MRRFREPRLGYSGNTPHPTAFIADRADHPVAADRIAHVIDEMPDPK